MLQTNYFIRRIIGPCAQAKVFVPVPNGRTQNIGIKPAVIERFQKQCTIVGYMSTFFGRESTKEKFKSCLHSHHNTSGQLLCKARGLSDCLFLKVNVKF